MSFELLPHLALLLAFGPETAGPALAAGQPPPLVSAVAALDGAWSGAFSLRGSDWPVRVDVDVAGAEPSVTIDLPELGMIEEPVPARAGDDGAVVVTVPFGLGDYELRADGDELHARSLAGNGIALGLQRPAVAARPYERREVAFATGDGLELTGTLYLPAGRAAHAGVVVLHGSAQDGRDRWPYRSWGPTYATLGLAALVYDKRPDELPHARDLHVLAGDARAAHAFLAAQPGLEAVGFAGGSQAAWLGAAVAAGEAAVEDAPVAFLVMSGWPAVTPREQEAQTLRNGMLADGIAPDLVEDALAYTDLLFYVARTGRLWPQLEPLVQDAASQPWGDYVNQPRSPDDLAWWSRNHDFGGEKHLRRVRCPALALYGGDDWVVPPAENADRLVRALAAAGNDDVHVAVFAGADHRGELPFTQEGGQVQWPRLADGWVEAIERWLGERGFVGER